MVRTIHTQRMGVNGDGFELSSRGDSIYMLRTWNSRRGRVRTIPAYLTMLDLEALFDSIGQVLVDENMDRLTQIMEAM